MFGLEIISITTVRPIQVSSLFLGIKEPVTSDANSRLALALGI